MPADSERPLLLYLHGFNSSPGSRKVAELRAVLPTCARRVFPTEMAEPELVVPELGFDPGHALQRAEAVVVTALEAGRPLGIVGSSLGGFYGSALSARYDLPVAMINPAVYPYRLLADYLGPQHNPYTGEFCVLTEGHVAELRSMDCRQAPPKNLMVLVQTGDETLDYREALTKHAGARTWIQPGGDHGFQGFVRVVPAILAFLFGRGFR